MADKCESSEPTAQAVPMLCEGVDIMSLDITPDEGFVLSRLDGVSNVDLLCKTSVLGLDKTMELLRALGEKGVVVFKEPGGAGKEGKPKEARAEGKNTGGEKKKEEPEESAPANSPVVAVEKDAAITEIRKIMRGPLPKGEDFEDLVEALFVNLERLSYYDFLGIQRNTEAAAIKKVYLKRTKSFHPDRFYRKADKEFRGKLQEIFKQLNQGYKTLTDAEARRAYDEKIEQAELDYEPPPVEDAKSRSRAAKGEAPKKKPKAAKEQKPAGPAKPKLKLGIREGKRPQSPLMRQIEKKVKEKSESSTSRQARKLYEGAVLEMERGNYKAAKINLKLAAQYDPGNREYKKALEGIDRTEESKRAETEFRRGEEAMAERDLTGALRHYREAMRLGFENAKLYNRMAELVIELERNYERARALALKAIELEEGVADFHSTLARAYKGLGQKAAAMIQLEKVLKLNPKDKLAAKELKALKRG